MSQQRFFPDYDRFDREHVATGYTQPSHDGIVDHDLNNQALTVTEVDHEGNLRRSIYHKDKPNNSFSL